MNPKPFFLLAALLLPLLVIAVPSHAQVYLDADSAQLPLTTLKPGDYASISLPYDVGFSRFGDEEHKDSEITFQAKEGNIRIWVGLGNDNVLFRVYRDSEIVYEKEVARQDCWWGCGAQGAVNIKLVETCNGQVQIRAFSSIIYSVTADTSTALTIMKDNDAVLLDQGTAYHCDGDNPIGYNPETSSIQKVAIAGAIGVVLAGLGLAMRGMG